MGIPFGMYIYMYSVMPDFWQFKFWFLGLYMVKIELLLRLYNAGRVWTIQLPWDSHPVVLFTAEGLQKR